MNVPKLLKIVLSVLSAGVALMVQAAPTEFPACPSEFYLSVGKESKTQLYEGSPNANGSVNFTLKSSAVPINYNAIAFHEGNRFIYGLEGRGSNMNPGPNARLIRIGANGETVIAGSVPGLTNKKYTYGDMDPAGNYYIRKNGSQLLKLSGIGAAGNELAGISTSIIPLTSPSGGAVNNIIGGDMAWVGDTAGGMLYTLKLSGVINTLYKIDPFSGVVEAIGTPFASPAKFGSLWGTPDSLYGSDNSGTGFYQFDLLTGQGVKIASAIFADSNDGARCVSNRPLFPADLGITNTNNQMVYTPGQTAQYTITATNNGPLGVLGAEVVNALPGGITTAAWTCTSGSGSCTDASGTGSINTTVDLPNGASAIFVVDMVIPLSFTGSLINTATVSVAKLGDGSPKTNLDSNTANNQATDTDTDGTLPVVVTHHEIPTLPWYGMIVMFLAFISSYCWPLGSIKTRTET